jgi:hypothetical protein
MAVIANRLIIIQVGSKNDRQLLNDIKLWGRFGWAAAQGQHSGECIRWNPVKANVVLFWLDVLPHLTLDSPAKPQTLKLDPRFTS